MKNLLARLLFRYLSLIGAVHCVTDPAAEVVDTSTSTESSVDDAANLGDEATQHEDEPADKAKRGDADPRDKTIAKLQRRVDNRTRGLGERDQRIADLERRLAERGSTTTTDEGDDDGEPAAREPKVDVETRAQEIARDTIERESIATKTKAMLKAGGDGFRELALELAEEIPFIDRNKRPTPFIKAVLDCDKPADVLRHIAGDHDLIADLADLTPTQLARRLTRIEIEIAKKPEKRSSAPQPLEPVNGRGDTSRDPKGMSDAEWREARLKKQV